MNNSYLGNILNNLKILNYREILANVGLKVTPQRIAVLETLESLQGHPSAEQIITNVRLKHPGIATGTIYYILDTLTEKKLISKVKTGSDCMRYDAIQEKHHHLYCSDSDKIEDYFDDELNQIIDNYLKNKAITNFTIEDFQLQLIGKFHSNNK